MKKFFLLVVAAILGIASWSCSDDYDDSAIWNEIKDIKSQIEKINSDLSKVQTAVTALESGKYVVDYTKTENGCTLKFNDGTSVTIENGKAGEVGASAPVIGVKESNGVYYWTLTTDGKESWLTYPETSDRIPVTGKDGAAPELGVDAEGYWTVNGEPLLDTNKQPVKAGADAWTSIFSGSEMSADNAFVVLTLANGGTIELPMQGKLSIAISTAEADFIFGEQKQFTLTVSGVDDITFTKPDGWKVTIEDNKLTVTAPVQENAYADKTGTIALIGMHGNYSCMAKLTVSISEPAILYSADGGEWTKMLPTTFSKLAIKTVDGEVVTKTMLDQIETNHTEGYSLDLSAADYESTEFRSYDAERDDPNTSLLAISLPRNIKTIPDQGFKNCVKLTSCIMPVGLEKVGDYGNVFSGATALTRMEFPEGATYLCKMMFYYFPMMGYGTDDAEPALEEVVIPSSVTNWQIGPVTTGSYWFYGCSNLKRIIVKLETPVAVSIGAWGDFSGVPADCVIYVPDASIEAYRNTEGWGDYSIKGLSELK